MVQRASVPVKLVLSGLVLTNPETVFCDREISERISALICEDVQFVTGWLAVQFRERTFRRGDWWNFVFVIFSTLVACDLTDGEIF